jgi:D-hexose-6-phosphate mutarotase
VGERDATVIDGFADDGSVPVTNSVDRSVRFGLPVPRRECIIHDQSRKLAVKIVSEGATGLNLWNPGAEKLCPGVIPGDEWRRFVAVEPFAMGMNRFFVLSADESLRLKMSVSLGL